MVEWKEIPGWEGLYEASEEGFIRSLDRVVKSRGGTRLHKGKPLVAHLATGDKYFYVDLHGFGKRKRSMVAHLVAEAFLGPRPDGLHVAHNNGDSHDNKAINLRYASPSENHLDKRAHGTMVCGETSNLSKLSEKEVIEIREALEQGANRRKLAAEFNVSRAAITGIASGKTWKHLGPIKVGRSRYGKLTDESIIEIKQRLREEQSAAHIARLFDVHRATILNIKHGKVWSDINE